MVRRGYLKGLIQGGGAGGRRQGREEGRERGDTASFSGVRLKQTFTGENRPAGRSRGGRGEKVAWSVEHRADQRRPPACDREL